MKKKIVSLVLVFAMALALGIGGTIAWLTDTTGEVMNTFTVGNIDIELEETTGSEYKMVPGNTLSKNPTVTVKAGSEKSWVFVKIEKSSNFDDFMSFEIADDWTALPNETGVYYCEVDAVNADTDFAVLKDNKVIVKDTVTKAMMDAITDETEPTLTFTAYAIQYSKGESNFTASEAWTELNKQPAA